MTAGGIEIEPQVRMKAEICGIGTAFPHVDDPGWTVRDWVMDGGDFPGIQGNHLGGWTLAELALVADLAQAAGRDVALERANAYRQVPVRPDADPGYVKGWLAGAETIAGLCEIKARDVVADRSSLRRRIINPAIAAVYRHAAEIARATTKAGP